MGFTSYFVKEELNHQTVDDFRIFVLLRLKGFNLDKRISQLKIDFVDETLIHVEYEYILENDKSPKTSFSIRKKEL